MQSEKSTLNSELLHFPVKTVFFILMVTVFSGVIFSFGVNTLAYSIYGVEQATFLEIISTGAASLGERTFLRITTLLNHALTFLVPSLVVAWLLYRKDWAKFLKINYFPYAFVLLFTLFFVLAAMPLVQVSIWVNQLIELPQWAVNIESQTEGVLRTFLTMETVGELALSFFVIAVLPAIGEELLFRGMIQQSLGRFFKNQHITVWVAALIFSFFHFQFAGFFARMLLGGLMGYLLVWTKNLWVPIFAHLLFNGMQVVVTYFNQDKIDEIDLETAEMPEIGLIIFSVIFVPMLGLRIQRYHKNKAIQNK